MNFYRLALMSELNEELNKLEATHGAIRDMDHQYIVFKDGYQYHRPALSQVTTANTKDQADRMRNYPMDQQMSWKAEHPVTPAQAILCDHDWAPPISLGDPQVCRKCPAIREGGTT